MVRRHPAPTRPSPSARRYRIEHWHLDDVSVLATSDDAAAARYVEPLRAAHASGAVVVIAEGDGQVVAWWPLWPVAEARPASA
jgi:hypothetical protein